VATSVSSKIKVELTNLEDLANNPPDLVEAVNQAFFRGELDATERGDPLGAASGLTNVQARGCERTLRGGGFASVRSGTLKQAGTS
jgi:hypothetical protein